MKRTNISLLVQVLLFLAIALPSLRVTTAQASTGSPSDGPLRAQEIDEPCLNTWFFRNKTTHKCECGPEIPNKLKCNQESKEVWMYVLYCMTYDNTTGTTVVGECPFGALHTTDPLSMNGDYVLLPENLTDLNEQMCGGLNRDDLLCSECKPGYGPAVLSYDKLCTRCSNKGSALAVYLTLSCVPTTLLFLIMLLCQVQTTSAPLNFFIFASQLISIQVSQNPQVTFGYTGLTKIAVGITLSFLGIWNLDFFRYFISFSCFSETLTELQVISMEYIIAFYPLAFVTLLYICIQQHARGCRVLVILWKPFSYCFSPLARHFNWNPLSSLIHVFASFLLLSSTKILFVSTNLLRVVELYVAESQKEVVTIQTRKSRLFYDPSLSVFSNAHLPYAALALCVPTVFVILPTFILILYPIPFFQRCLNSCGFRWHAIQAFSDSFSGCYKDGRDGTRDCRSFAGFYMLLHIVFILIYCTPTFIHVWLHSVTIIATLLLMAIVRPYRYRSYNLVDISFLTASAVFFAAPQKYYNLMGVLGVVMLILYFFGYITYKIISKVKYTCFPKIKKFTGQLFKSKVTADPERQASGSDSDDILPDRLTNPERYTRRLYDHNEEQTPLLNHCTNNFPTYGIEQ